MRKKAIMLFALSAFLCLTVAVGCRQSQAEVPDGFYLTADSFLKWNEVKNADNYIVNIDGTEYTVSKNEIDIFDKCTESKEYQIKVRAYGKKLALTDAGNYVFNAYYPSAFGYKSTNDGSGVEIIVMNADKLPANVVGPSVIDGNPVVALANKAFYNCKSVASVYMPDSITTMGGNVFYACENLVRVRIAPDIEKIQSMSFFACKKLKNIELPNGLKQIQSAAFNSCVSLEKIELPDSLTSLELSAFTGCQSLKRLEIPEHTESISPNGLDMEEIIVHPENKKYYALNNCIIRKSDNVLISGGKYSSIPEAATAIAEKAFCQSLLTKIDIPSNIKTIGNDAFTYSALNEITIANGVEEIYSAFGHCKLKKLTIPASVTQIDRLVYGDCNVEELSVSSGNKVYYSVDNYVLTKEGNTVIAGILSRNTIPAVAEEIGQFAFARHDYVEEMIIPANIKRICSFAFSSCGNLGKVVFEGGEIIERMSFGNCINLKSVLFSKNVKEVGQGAFNYTNIVSVTLPEGVKPDEYHFYFRPDVTVYYPQGVDLSNIRYRDDLIQYDVGYDSDFPYVKSIKSNLIIEDFGGKTIETSEYKSKKLSVPERAGYFFEGWSKREDCKTIDYPVYTSPDFWNSDIAFLFLESKHTYNPFYNSKFNTAYDPNVKVLYAVWKKI